MFFSYETGTLWVPVDVCCGETVSAGSTGAHGLGFVQQRCQRLHDIDKDLHNHSETCDFRGDVLVRGPVSGTASRPRPSSSVTRLAPVLHVPRRRKRKTAAVLCLGVHDTVRKLGRTRLRSLRGQKFVISTGLDSVPANRVEGVRELRRQSSMQLVNRSPASTFILPSPRLSAGTVSRF